MGTSAGVLCVAFAIFFGWAREVAEDGSGFQMIFDILTGILVMNIIVFLPFWVSTSVIALGAVWRYRIWDKKK